MKTKVPKIFGISSSPLQSTANQYQKQIFTYHALPTPQANQPVLEPILDLSGITQELARVLPRRPCSRTVQRWVQQGMPYHLKPRGRGKGGRSSRWFLFSEVYAWLKGATCSRDLVQEAVDLVHQGRRPRQTK